MFIIIDNWCSGDTRAVSPETLSWQGTVLARSPSESIAL